MPLGLAALHTDRGPMTLLVPFLVVVASDSAQYYGGRTLGRRPLAPRISPKKTVEGAIAGVPAAAAATPFLARITIPDAPIGLMVLLGVLIAIIGIMGDLFESLLKRASGIKDCSILATGRGILDRIDALLFVFRRYALFLRYTGLQMPSASAPCASRSSARPARSATARWPSSTRTPIGSR